MDKVELSTGYVMSLPEFLCWIMEDVRWSIVRTKISHVKDEALRERLMAALLQVRLQQASSQSAWNSRINVRQENSLLHTISLGLLE